MYPDLCVSCGEVLVEEEAHVCIACLNSFPKTRYHELPDNEVEKRFWGKVPIERATAFFFYEKDSDLQRVIYQLKYKGRKEVGLSLGGYAGVTLAEAGMYKDVDVIVPVPLHPNKLAQRGYNQSDWIAQGLAKHLGKPIDTEHLKRCRENESQTRKKAAIERYENTVGMFELPCPEVFDGKHVLLVDDVLTTGSTMEACVHPLLRARDVKVSVFAVATVH